jgi:hypothetical protein
MSRTQSQLGSAKFVPPSTFGTPERERHPIQAKQQDPDLARLLAMDHKIKSASPSELSKLPALEAAIKRAEVIEELKAALTDQVMDRFLPLMNTALGFRTDRPNKRNPTPYTKDEVRDCFVEALLLGLRLTDNEWNIIALRCYVTREGLTRLLCDHPGLTDLKIDAGVPLGDKARGVTVAFKCSWRLNNIADELEAVIPVRGDEYATLDQLLGKADRKIKARIHARVTGSTLTREGEVEYELEGAQKPSDTQSALDTLKARQAEAAKPAAAASAPAPEPEKPAEPARSGKSKGDANAEPTAEELAASSKEPSPWDQ